MANLPLSQRPLTADVPPVSGMPSEVWSWLRESLSVRPHVVARVRASLASGETPSPDDVALAILAGRG